MQSEYLLFLGRNPVSQQQQVISCAFFRLRLKCWPLFRLYVRLFAAFLLMLLSHKPVWWSLSLATSNSPCVFNSFCFPLRCILSNLFLVVLSFSLYRLYYIVWVCVRLCVAFHFKATDTCMEISFICKHIFRTVRIGNEQRYIVRVSDNKTKFPQKFIHHKLDGLNCPICPYFTELIFQNGWTHHMIVILLHHPVSFRQTEHTFISFIQLVSVQAPSIATIWTIRLSNVEL